MKVVFLPFALLVVCQCFRQSRKLFQSRSSSYLPGEFQLRFQQSSAFDAKYHPVRVVTKSGYRVLIRPAKFDEIEAIAALRISVFFPSLQNDEIFRRDLIASIRQRFFQKSSLQVAYLETMTPSSPSSNSIDSLSNQLVGTMEVSILDWDSSTLMESISSSRKVYISDLAIREEARQIGIATAILDQLDNDASAEGINEVLLHAKLDNIIAQDLYKKRGFELLMMERAHHEFTQKLFNQTAAQYVMMMKTLHPSSQFNLKRRLSSVDRISVS